MQPITLDALAFFCTSPGRDLLAQAAAESGDEFQIQKKLRAHYPAQFCRAALALVLLRQKARQKFALADSMFFDRDGLEMATREEIACYRAARLDGYNTVLDLCCGIGGDLLALGARANVHAVELDRTRLEMARMNAAAAGLEHINFIQADVGTLRPRADAVFLDPARRQENRRTLRGDAYSPPLSHIEVIRQFTPEVLVKVAPAIDEEELPADCEIEFISAAGQCREAVLYFGKLATAARRATILPGRHTLTDTQTRPVPVGPAGAYVYDPDPAVVRSHLIDPLAHQLDAWKLDPQIAYLSGDHLHTTPFARAYQVLTCLPFHLKRLRRFLIGENMYPHEIKKRRFPLDSDDLRRQLKISSGAHPVTLIATRLADKPVVFICKRREN